MSDIHLTDEQYLKVLEDQLSRLIDGKVVESFDCTDTGMKHTETNVGVCDDGLVTKDNSMWPEQFPHRKDMKYRRSHHICPLDKRHKGAAGGCFYRCRVFQEGLKDIREIKSYYARRIGQMRYRVGQGQKKKEAARETN